MVGFQKELPTKVLLHAFIKAVAFEPAYKLHQYELAQTYLEMGKKANAKGVVSKGY
jgi:hypothetical protein